MTLTHKALNMEQLKQPNLFKRIMKRITGYHWFALAVICLIGFIFIYISHSLPEAIEKNGMKTENLWHHLFRDIGIALFPIGIVSIVYETILRNNFIENMTKTIREQMPSRYTHLREAGVVDIYPDLQIDKLKKNIETIEDCEIRIIDIWMENFNRVENALIDSIHFRKCKVKILLWDPRQLEAIERRADALGKITHESIVLNILLNLEAIINMQSTLKEKGCDENLFQVKLYNSFIGVSFISYGNECLVGNYLRDRVSSMGTQLKVSGEQHFFYKELNKHFISQWDDAHNLPLTEELYKDLKKWHDDFVRKDSK